MGRHEPMVELHIAMRRLNLRRHPRNGGQLIIERKMTHLNRGIAKRCVADWMAKVFAISTTGPTCLARNRYWILGYRIACDIPANYRLMEI